jgi:[FeFe] hydrogenase H-cluster maturation GTPase HydF
MSLNDTVSAERVHIGFFGMRNAGKSSVVNAVTGQALSVVSPVKGTTTDPVKKAMELLPLGPVVIVDTPGLDDEGELGALRVKKAREVLGVIDIAVLVVDAARGLTAEDKALLAAFGEKKLPYVVALNKCDLLSARPAPDENALYVSAVTGEGIGALKERLGAFAKDIANKKTILADLVSPGDTVVLVIPIDASAPKGRIILPQQQVLRELLDLGCAAVCVQPGALTKTLENLQTPPALVVTDSQAFGRVSPMVPENVPFTSFSILFARYKGEMGQLLSGAAALRTLKTGDRVLISEGCTHHRQCGDIGTEKLPAWIKAYANAEPEFSFTSGGEFPEDLSPYALIVHCGGCMLSETAMKSRLAAAKAQGVPMLNYGMAIAEMNGVLRRALQPFGL